MKKDFNCPYSILERDIMCEHKTTQFYLSPQPTLHNHDGYELLLFLNGDANIFVESTGKKMLPGDLIIIPPFSFHGAILIDIANYERIVLNIRPQILKKISDATTDLSTCLQSESPSRLNFIHIDEAHLSSFVEIMDKLQSALNDTCYGHTLLAKAYLAEFLITVSNYAHRTETNSFDNIMSPLMAKLFRYIDSNITNNITIEQIATNLHHNSDYLGRVFKENTGGSLKHYINAKKISLAQQYLSQGYTPYEVCFMTGYNNYSSFSRRFSAHIGLSPKQYQQKVKND